MIFFDKKINKLCPEESKVPRTLFDIRMGAHVNTRNCTREDKDKDLIGDA